MYVHTDPAFTGTGKGFGFHVEALGCIDVVLCMYGLPAMDHFLGNLIGVRMKRGTGRP
jgi:hypothetical protein